MYNFVIFSSPLDYYDVSYYDVMKLANVRYIRDIRGTKNQLLKLCYKIHFSKKFNSLINNPFKTKWNRFLFKNEFSDNSPICFLFSERMLYLDNFGFMDCLKENYLDSKFVCYLQDLVKTIDDANIQTIINKFDLSITYDKNDALKYGMICYPTPYSFYPIEKRQNIKPSDVYFTGKAKDRFKKIISFYEKLKIEGLSCDFSISGVKLKDRVYADDINYISCLSYKENLEHILNTKCLLEIMQQDAVGYTPRTWEAIMYNKLLLTNNMCIKHAPFYNHQYIQICEDSNFVKTSFIKNTPEEIDYKFKDKLSPKILLDFIEKKIGRDSNLS